MNFRRDIKYPSLKFLCKMFVFEHFFWLNAAYFLKGVDDPKKLITMDLGVVPICKIPNNLSN